MGVWASHPQADDVQPSSGTRPFRAAPQVSPSWMALADARRPRRALHAAAAAAPTTAAASTSTSTTTAPSTTTPTITTKFPSVTTQKPHAATASSSSSGSGSSAAAVEFLKQSAGEGDSCQFYSVADNCHPYRQCRDCLNARIYDTTAGAVQPCMLTQTGTCMTMYSYIPSYDFRASNTSDHNQFPSNNATYCSATDAACARCRAIAEDPTSAKHTANATDAEIQRGFCIGTNGCVCLVDCETDLWNNSHPYDCVRRDSGSSGTAIASTTGDSYRSIFPIFMVVQVMLILVVIHRQRMAALRSQPVAIAEGPYNNVGAISSPRNRLQLSGWRRMQEHQVQREKAQHRLVSLMSPRGGLDDNFVVDPPEHLCDRDGTHSGHGRRGSTGVAILEDASRFSML